MNTVFSDVLSQLNSATQPLPQARYVTSGGLEWLVRETGGTGIPLVLLPGSLGTADIFFRQIEAFIGRINCLTIDYPAGENIEIAKGLAELLDQLSIPKAHLLGASLAGHWLQYFADFYPDRIASIVFASTFADSEELRHHPLFDLEMLKRSSGDYVKTHWLGFLESQPKTELLEVQLKLLRDGQAGEVLRSRLLAAGGAVPSPTVSLPQDKIAIIDCEDDPLLPEKTRNALAIRYPKAKRLTLPSGGHYPHVTRAEAYNSFLEAFLFL